MDETDNISQEEKTARDYTRDVYQNLMQVVELLEGKSPLPMTQREIAYTLPLSKNRIFDICWNLCKRGWAEETGDGSVRLKRGTDEKAAYIGRMMTRMVRDTYGLDIKIEEEAKGHESEKA